MMDKVDVYIGKKVIIKGFVFKQDNLDENTFVAARMLMVCCAADAQIIGLLCEWKDRDTLEANEWVQIEGTVEATKYYDPYNKEEYIVPLIKASKVMETERPITQFVYP